MSQWIPKNEHIKYLRVEKPVLLSDFLKSELKCSPEKVTELLLLGAIHIHKKRVLQDVLLKKGDELRVHLFPKRYPIHTVLWKNHVLFENSDCVVLNKPCGIPVPPTVDNISENVLHAVSEQLKIPLYITQRLDRGTSGLLFLAKTKSFQSEYNRHILDKTIKKKYLALTRTPVPDGLHTHFISEATRIPKEVRDSAGVGFKEARLIVEKCIPYTFKEQSYFESQIELITGRTHQIRAQYAHLNSPLIGDRTYGGEETPDFNFDGFALHACEIQFADYHFVCPPRWRVPV